MSSAVERENLHDLLCAYRQHGGVAREIEVLLRFQRSSASAACRRPEGFDRAIRVTWNGWVWMPLFQFDRSTLALRSAPAMVMDELSPAFDECAVAHWFWHPNGCLSHRRPLEVVDQQPRLVLKAARIDRSRAER
jgi:hypothetical protein